MRALRVYGWPAVHDSTAEFDVTLHLFWAIDNGVIRHPSATDRVYEQRARGHEFLRYRTYAQSVMGDTARKPTTPNPRRLWNMAAALHRQEHPAS